MSVPPKTASDKTLDFPQQFDDLWQKMEEIATTAIDEHHECGGGEDAHIIANEVRQLVAAHTKAVLTELTQKLPERVRSNSAQVNVVNPQVREFKQAEANGYNRALTEVSQAIKEAIEKQ